MYIVRWLMGHPIIATWVLAAVAILLTFGSGNKADDSVEKSVKTSVSKQYEEVKAEISTELANGKIIEKSAVVELAVNTVKKTAPDVSNAVTPVTDKTIASNSTIANKATNNEVAASSEKAPFVTTNDNVSVKKSAETKLDATKDPSASDSAAVADLGQSTTEEMLLMAREAYWNNGLDEAAQIYEKLIEIEPKVIEHKGELGNVYWRQGYPKKAAELYSDIAIPMIEKGGSERVANMIGFIGLFYPERAAEIHKRIQLSRQNEQSK